VHHTDAITCDQAKAFRDVIRKHLASHHALTASMSREMIRGVQMRSPEHPERRARPRVSRRNQRDRDNKFLKDCGIEPVEFYFDGTGERIDPNGIRGI
jgi:hypothetical protein